MTTLQQRLARVEAQLEARFVPPPAVPVLAPMDAVALWHQAMGTAPDPWQETILRGDDRRICLNCCRQAGKVFDAYETSGRTVPQEAETKLALELSNGSRILALPGGDEAAIRGFSGVRCLIIDEAARCPDLLYVALRPMLVVSGGSIMVLSTPFGRRGFFHRVWSQAHGWLKIQVTAAQCPRMSPEFLAEERIELGPRWYGQEYECQFVEAVGQLFSDAAIDAAFSDDVTPLFAEEADGDPMLVDLPGLFVGD